VSHVCPAASGIGEPTKFCPTAGICPICGGLLCAEHGCQRDQGHVPERDRKRRIGVTFGQLRGIANESSR